MKKISLADLPKGWEKEALLCSEKETVELRRIFSEMEKTGGVVIEDTCCPSVIILTPDGKVFRLKEELNRKVLCSFL